MAFDLVARRFKCLDRGLLHFCARAGARHILCVGLATCLGCRNGNQAHSCGQDSGRGTRCKVAFELRFSSSPTVGSVL